MRQNFGIIFYITFATTLYAYSANAENKNTGLAGSKYVKGSAGYATARYSGIQEKQDLSALGLSKETSFVGTVPLRSFTPEIAFCYYLTDSIRTELAVSTSLLKGENSENLPSVGNDVVGIQNVKIRESDIFLNGYYDFNTSGSVRPYVKLGVGYMFMKKTSTISNANVDFANMERKFNNLAAAAGIGILYNVSDKFFLDIGYTAKFAFKTNETYSITRSEENTKKLSDIPSIKGECLAKNSFGTLSIAVGFRF
ncbi:OmpW family outer membrane protein [Candidatus Lariskella endosymbiont of Epinotia ramella]|uniref:OmpW family outer membrane protein n=1 Tax=Candidatus Lariskella endosymbiont of Epinotia ramella TaxID=3066224 RepID=UPI0030CF4945